MAKHGIEFLLKHAFDDDGRMFYLLTRDGRPVRKRRYLFTETFGVIALAEYGKAAGDPRMIQRAKDLYALIQKYRHTPGLLPPKAIPETRSTRSHAMPMIMLATSQVLRNLDPDPYYDQVITEAIAEVFDYFVKPEKKCVLETVLED